jgi:hypothetical protein
LGYLLRRYPNKKRVKSHCDPPSSLRKERN